MVFTRSQIFAQAVNVTTAAQLQAALNVASAGQVIILADGLYTKSSGFIVPKGINGTALQPITLTSNGNAILSTGNIASSNALWLKGNNYWKIIDLKIRNAKKGIIIDSSFYTVIKNIDVKNIGEEGIHLRTFSSYNTVSNCFIDSTGLATPGFGEGIYVGSAVSNWCTYTNCVEDTCNYNIVTNNSFGLQVKAENIDIKEGTKFGTISNNIFNGNGLGNFNSADSWIDVKGNNYTIINNTGTSTIADGFQTHIAAVGYGNFNYFANNNLVVNNSTNYGIAIQTNNLNGTALNNIVCTNNVVTGLNAGLTNIAPQVCTVLANKWITNFTVKKIDKTVKISWNVSSINEINYFDIETSNNGIAFTKLKSVFTNGLNYQIEEINVNTSIKFVRLVLNLKNGAKEYSNILYVKVTDVVQVIGVQNQSIVIYSNEVSNIVMKLFSYNGSLLNIEKIKNGYNYININNITKGIYFIEFDISTSTEKLVTKIII